MSSADFPKWRASPCSQNVDMNNLRCLSIVTRWLFVLSLTVGCATNAAASPFDGKWSIEWPCEGAVGIYVEMCAQGSRDYFLLDLWTTGSAVCGSHIATAHLGNRVDDGGQLDGNPTLTGTMDGSSAKVEYRSAWGATGLATLQVEGDQLRWKVQSQSEGVSWLPDDAVLKKLPLAGRTALRDCRLQE